MTTSAPPPLRPADRIPPERFQLPVDRMRQGCHSDKYFARTRDVLVRSGRNPRGTAAYGVESSLFSGRYDVTADVVLVDDRPVAKQGRWYRPNPKRERVE